MTVCVCVFVYRSWASEPEKRPTDKAAADEVRAMQAAYTADSTPWNAVCTCFLVFYCE